jgi:hypothetical protein
MGQGGLWRKERVRAWYNSTVRIRRRKSVCGDGIKRVCVCGCGKERDGLRVREREREIVYVCVRVKEG